MERNFELNYSSAIVEYWKKKLEYLIWLADQAEKEGNIALMNELDEEIERIKRILRLFNRSLYKNELENTLSR